MTSNPKTSPDRTVETERRVGTERRGGTDRGGGTAQTTDTDRSRNTDRPSSTDDTCGPDDPRDPDDTSTDRVGGAERSSRERRRDGADRSNCVDRQSGDTRRAGTDSADAGTDGVQYVLGGGHTGTAVARRLRADGHAVVLVDEISHDSEIPGPKGDPTDVRVLDDAGVERASRVIVASECDRRNLLIAQHVRSRYDVDRILVLANEPPMLDLLADAGHEPVCATTALSAALLETI